MTTYNNMPYIVVKLREVIGGVTTYTVILNISNMTVNSDESSARTANFTIENTDPSDLTDWGYFNPHRNDSTHGKPSNTWYQKLVPNAGIEIEAGFEDNYVNIFYGTIDSVEMNYESEDCILNVTCRDQLKLLLDQDANYWSDLEQVYSIEYPLDESVDPVAGGVTSSDTEADLFMEDIIRDICIRSGMDPSMVNIPFYLSDRTDDQRTGILLQDTSLFNTGEFIGKWQDLIEKIKTIALFDFWCDEDGITQFRHRQSKVMTKTDDFIYLNGTDPSALSAGFAVEATIVVKNFDNTITYEVDVDYVFDEDTNSISAVEDSPIEDTWVNVTYGFVDYVFLEGVNIFRLPLRFSHDNLYSKIIVQDPEDPKTILHTEIVATTMWDGSALLADKILFVSDESINDSDAAETLALRLKNDMRERYSSTEFECIPVPWLQIGDVIQVKVIGLISQNYVIDGITISRTSDDYTMNIKCHYYSYNPIV